MDKVRTNPVTTCKRLGVRVDMIFDESVVAVDLSHYQIVRAARVELRERSPRPDQSRMVLRDHRHSASPGIFRTRATMASFTLSGSEAQASSRSLSRSSSPNSALYCAVPCCESGVSCGKMGTGSSPVSPTPRRQQGSPLITPDQLSPSFIGSAEGR